MQRRIHCLSGCVVLAIMGGLVSAEATAAPLPLVAKHSGKCLDITGGPGATQNGALAEQWECTGASNQSWTLLDMGGGQIELIAQHSNKCIEAVGGGTVRGTQIQQTACTGAPAQLWTQQSAGATGEFKFVHVPSDLCLDVTGGPQATGNGPPMELWDCTGANNQTWTIGRNPLYWPFAQNSIWNTPIGSSAVYVAANLPAIPDDPTDQTAAEWSPMPNIDEERIVLTPTAPITTIEFSNAGWNNTRDRCIATGGTIAGLPVTVPMPASYVLGGTPQKNNGAAFLMPDRRTLIQTQPLARCVAGGPATSIARLTDGGVDADIFGNGRVGAHGGSKLSTLGGTIRRGEMRPGSRGPRHALKVLVYEKMDFHNCDGTAQNPCFRWPAFVADSGAAANYGSIRNNVQAMRMGALLAIPASINLDTLGLESEPGRQIAWTLQN